MNAVYHIARITLETATPLSIATGQANGVFDTSLVVDANGLPAIPGSSLAGVLRHLYQDEYGETESNTLFGYQDRKKGDDSQPSRLNVSWGCIQDSKGQALQGLELDEKAQNDLKKDPILSVAQKLAYMPVTRDRVRIGHKGAASHQGKFDRAVLPAGYRFTVELSLWGEKANDAQWEQVLDLLAHPLFRLGGSTRAGLGKLQVIEIQQCIVDLQQKTGRTTFTEIKRDLNDRSGFSLRQLPEWNGENKVVAATITLTPNSYWRIGQGDNPQLKIPGKKLNDPPKTADLLPKLEQRISWKASGQAEGAAETLLIPAASVKGALSHRIAFHANRFAKLWAEDFLQPDENDKQQDFDKSEHCEAVRQLFGFTNDDTRKGDDQKGQAGCVFIDDAYRELSTDKLQIIMHNSIDRFSGSVRDHMLFSEEMVWGEGVDLQLTIKTQGYDGNAISDDAKKALNLALNDLCQGRLALGAGVSKGHGFFTGTVEWSDGGKWIGETA